MVKCIECNKEIATGESAVNIINGSFEKDDFNGIAFEEAKSLKSLGFMHFTCLDTK